MGKIGNLIRSHGAVWMCAALVFAPNVVTAYFLAQDESVLLAVYLLLFSLIALSVPLILVKTLRQFFVAYIPLAFLAPAYGAYILGFRRPPGEGIIAAIVHTNLGEALEFIQFAGWVAFAPLLSGVAYTIFVVRSRALGTKIDVRVKKVLAGAISTYLIVALISFDITGGGLQRRKPGLFMSADLPGRSIALVDQQTVQNSFPLGLVRAFTEMASFTNAVGASTYRFHASKRQVVAGKEVYVLIIGESARFQNWGVNGYGRQTSPNLSELVRQGQAISFSNMAAQSNLTLFAVSMMVSGESPEKYAKTKRIEATVASAFKEAGFTTGWISNQDFLYPPTVDFSDFDWSLHRFDEAMLPAIDRALARHDDKIFLVIHTRGSHYHYDQRYAKRHRVFVPTFDEIQGLLSTGYGDKSKAIRGAIVNSYDNSILATDELIGKIISLVNSKQAVSTVLFVPDHGEDLFDDKRYLFMHGKPHATKYETHIPAFLWTSAAFRARYPEKQKALKEHANSKLSQSNVLPTLLDLADISLPNENLTKSFASEKFVAPVRRDVLTASSFIENYEDLE